MSTWNIDPAHSEIGFKVRHLMVSTVKGFFSTYKATIISSDDTLSDAKVTFEAEVKSLTTNNAQRDGHLMSPDFFDAEQFTKLSFISKSFTKKSETEFSMIGDLSMKDFTKEVNLNVILGGIVKGMDGKRVAGFEVSGKINRTDFGLVWNAPTETGVVVSNEVTLEANVEMKEE